MARDGLQTTGAVKGFTCSAGVPESVWRKSSYSNHDGACVEVAESDSATVAFRDSKVSDGPVLRFSRRTAAAFITALGGGEL